MAKKENKKVKKNKKIVANTPAHYNEEVVRIVKIGVVVLVCFAVIYIGTALINKYRNQESEVETEIQNLEILMGETFEKKDSEYIVLYYDFTDKVYSNLYDMMVEKYNSVNLDVPMYKVDLSTNFSKKYMALEEEASNKNPTSLETLKVKGSTLIRIKDKKVVAYLEGKDSIKNYINGLTN